MHHNHLEQGRIKAEGERHASKTGWQTRVIVSIGLIAAIIIALMVISAL